MKMKQLLFAAGLLFTITIATAQDPDIKTLKETATNYMHQGDFTNAIMVLNKAAQKDPNSLELQRDLAFAYYLNRDYAKALEVSKPFENRPDADVESFQILGMVYKALEETKDCDRMYKTALKKFPASGILYSEYGEVLWSKKNFSDAAKQWEKGIEIDPNCSGNYYNAAKYYYFSSDKVWGLIYGEMFVNIESYSKRTAEIKDLLVEGYKKLFTGDLSKGQDTKNDFVRAFLDVMKSQSSYINSNGVTPETLTAARTKFTLDWFQKYAMAFPFRLFDYHQQLLKAGMFDAYNQWLFGTAANLPAYETWTKAHTQEHDQFEYFQHNRVFKVPPGQYYQNK